MKIALFKNLPLICTLSLAGIQCSSGNIVERPFPKSEAPAIATPGSVIYSHARTDEGTGNKKITYVYWKFVKADSGNIYLKYEEYYQNLKNQPDLTEDRSIALKQDILLGKCRLVIYRLKSAQMWYSLEFPQNEGK